jgi:hypothetical protein
LAKNLISHPPPPENDIFPLPVIRQKINFLCTLFGLFFPLLHSFYLRVSILENTPPPPQGTGNISCCHLGKKYEKGEEKKNGNCKWKLKKGERKGRKGKEKEKMGIKMVK